jgi:hypothetical protein
MIPWVAFRNMVAEIVSTMDCVEQCRLGSLLDTIDCAPAARKTRWSRTEAFEVVEKMRASGLLAYDETSHGTIVSITPKGAALALDIRTLVGGAVRP